MHAAETGAGAVMSATVHAPAAPMAGAVVKKQSAHLRRPHPLCASMDPVVMPLATAASGITGTHGAVVLTTPTTLNLTCSAAAASDYFCFNRNYRVQWPSSRSVLSLL